MGGELGELLEGFNTMASKLEAYNEANIEELTAAQVKQQSLIATMADGAVLLDEEVRIVLQAVRDASGESLKGIAMTVQDLSGRCRSTPPRAVSSATSPMSCAHRCSTSRATWKLSMTWGIC